MTLLQSIILGIVQGFTEFFPVSSSAHLRLARWLMSVPDGKHFLYFDLVCHSGTILALIFCMRKDIVAALRSRKAIALFSLALFPLVPAYFLLKPLRIAASDPAYLGYFLIFTAFLLFAASQNSKKREVGVSLSKNSTIGLKEPENRPSHSGTGSNPFPKVKDVLCIGIMQTLALLPGISRSGSTIAAGRLLGWDWVAAARFSFLLAIPAILGGQALETLKLLREPVEAMPTLSIGCYAAGFCASFATGMTGIGFMFKIYEKGIVRPFAWYCLAVGFLAFWAFHG